MSDQIRVGTRPVGAGAPTLLIAEAGVNHNGQMALAHRLIDAAVEAGADAIKFQAFVTEELVTPRAAKAGYQVNTTGEAGSQFRMLKQLELGPEQQAALKQHCDEAGILYLCTPYDWPSVELLDRLDVAAFKIASTDTTNVPFLRFLATRKRPVLLSTGMSTLAEVEQGVAALNEGGLTRDIVLLHCTSEYPAPLEESNLRAMATLARAFGYPVGFSDHTPGIGASPWAVALGAAVIEKHFTLDRTLEGPDHRASLEPQELAELVRTVREVEGALGDGIKRPTRSELPNKRLMQKSLVTRRALAAGEPVQETNLTTKRPASGLPPAWWDRVIGRRTTRALPADHTLTLEDIEWGE